MKKTPFLIRFIVVFLLAAVPVGFAEPIAAYKERLPVSKLKIAVRKAVNWAATPSVLKPFPAAGIASWYSKTDPGINKHTANGEVFDDRKMTCASWHYPFGTLLKVTNIKTGKSVVVRVNDRGPAKRLNRVIDLSLAAFKRIADPRKGLIQVHVKKVG